MSGIKAFRMLVLGGQFPFRDGYVIGPDGARKWVQRGHAGQRDAVELPTIVGECRPLPVDEWAHFALGIEQSGILEVTGNPYNPQFHQPTWYFEVDLGVARKRLKAYGAGAVERLTGAGWEDKDVWAAALAISEVELFELRVPWTERLAALPVESVAQPLLDLLAIDGPWIPGKVPPHVEPR